MRKILKSCLAALFLAFITQSVSIASQPPILNELFKLGFSGTKRTDVHIDHIKQAHVSDGKFNLTLPVEELQDSIITHIFGQNR